MADGEVVEAPALGAGSGLGQGGEAGSAHLGEPSRRKWTLLLQWFTQDTDKLTYSQFQGQGTRSVDPGHIISTSGIYNLILLVTKTFHLPYHLLARY